MLVPLTIHCVDGKETFWREAPGSQPGLIYRVFHIRTLNDKLILVITDSLFVCPQRDSISC